MQHILSHPEVHTHSEQRMQQMQGSHQDQNVHRPDNGMKQATDHQVLQAQPEVDPLGNCSNVNIEMSDNSCISDTSNESIKNNSRNDQKQEKRCRKKGGKVKGTLETSVEIRNRMIGMSEAGLSTLSIALAINRSVS